MADIVQAAKDLASSADITGDEKKVWSYLQNYLATTLGDEVASLENENGLKKLSAVAIITEEMRADAAKKEVSIEERGQAPTVTGKTATDLEMGRSQRTAREQVFLITFSLISGTETSLSMKDWLRASYLASKIEFAADLSTEGRVTPRIAALEQALKAEENPMKTFAETREFIATQTADMLEKLSVAESIVPRELLGGIEQTLTSVGKSAEALSSMEDAPRLTELCNALVKISYAVKESAQLKLPHTSKEIIAKTLPKIIESLATAREIVGLPKSEITAEEITEIANEPLKKDPLLSASTPSPQPDNGVMGFLKKMLTSVASFFKKILPNIFSKNSDKETALARSPDSVNMPATQTKNPELEKAHQEKIEEIVILLQAAGATIDKASTQEFSPQPPRVRTTSVDSATDAASVVEAIEAVPVSVESLTAAQSDTAYGREGVQPGFVAKMVRAKQSKDCPAR